MLFICFWKTSDWCITFTVHSRAPEILFKPELIGRDHYGMHESVFKSILSSDIDLRRRFLENIVLSGNSWFLLVMLNILNPRNELQTPHRPACWFILTPLVNSSLKIRAVFFMCSSPVWFGSVSFKFFYLFIVIWMKVGILCCLASRSVFRLRLRVWFLQTWG